MPDQFARIPTKSQSQAMDWSLLLASQGLDCAIEAPQNNDNGQWSLLLAPRDHLAALDVIGLYERENRHWRWRKQLLKPGLLFDWTILLWVLLLAVFYLAADIRPAFRQLGVMDSAAVSAGQFWRLATAVWLHADLAHLVGNAVLGLVLIGLAMGRYGSGTGLLAALLSGIAGNALAWLISPRQVSLGASGVVMGGLGLLAAGLLSPRLREPNALKQALRALFAGILLFVLVGLNPDSDVRGHLGGFISGLVLGSLLTLWPKPVRSPTLNLLSACLFTALVIYPWWRAFHSH